MPINSQVFFFSALPFLVSLIVELVNIKMNNWRMIILPPTTESHSEFLYLMSSFLEPVSRFRTVLVLKMSHLCFGTFENRRYPGSLV